MDQRATNYLLQFTQMPDTAQVLANTILCQYQQDCYQRTPNSATFRPRLNSSELEKSKLKDQPHSDNDEKCEKKKVLRQPNFNGASCDSSVTAESGKEVLLEDTLIAK